MSETKYITLENHSFQPFIFNYKEGEKVVKTYEWKPIKGSIVDKKKVDYDHYLDLLQICNVIQRGRLVISKENEEVKQEALEEFEANNYENNALTREDALKILNSKVSVFKEKLAEITSESTLQFLSDLAKEEGLDSISKQKALAEALGKRADTILE